MKKLLLTIGLILFAGIGFLIFNTMSTDTDTNNQQSSTQSQVSRLPLDGNAYIISLKDGSKEKYIGWMEEYSDGTKQFKANFVLDENNTVVAYPQFLSRTKQSGISTVQANDAKVIDYGLVSDFEILPENSSISRAIDEIINAEQEAVDRELSGQ